MGALAPQTGQCLGHCFDPPVRVNQFLFRFDICISGRRTLDLPPNDFVVNRGILPLIFALGHTAISGISGFYGNKKGPGESEGCRHQLHAFHKSAPLWRSSILEKPKCILQKIILFGALH